MEPIKLQLINQNSRVNIVSICLILLVLYSFAASWAIAKQKLSITEQVNIAIAERNAHQFRGLTHQIYAIWDGNKSPTSDWRKLRQEQVTVLLKSLEAIEKQVDWAFDDTQNAEDLLQPPLDHSIMKYAKGFGTRLIKDSNKKSEIEQKLKIELTRLKQAKLNRAFQRQVNQHYERWLDAFQSMLLNHYQQSAIASNSSDISAIIAESIQSTKFRSCLQKLTQIFYSKGYNVLDKQIRKHNGNCKLILSEHH